MITNVVSTKARKLKKRFCKVLFAWESFYYLFGRWSWSFKKSLHKVKLLTQWDDFFKILMTISHNEMGKLVHYMVLPAKWNSLLWKNGLPLLSPGQLQDPVLELEASHQKQLSRPPLGLRRVGAMLCMGCRERASWDCTVRLLRGHLRSPK